MNILVRPARAEDYPAVEAIMRQVQELHVQMRPDIYRPCVCVLPEELFLELVAQNLFFVAEAEGQVVGVLSVQYRHVGNPLQVERDIVVADSVGVDEPWRGRGVGRAMLEFLRRLRDEKGLDGIELQVNARNAAAIAMYEACGFTPKSVNMELL